MMGLIRKLWRRPMVTVDNSPEKVAFRQGVLELEKHLAAFASKNVGELMPLKHHFAPVDPKYGCGVYARELFIPKGSWIIGKIHKTKHLNFLMKGKIAVYTEHGAKYLEAPYLFVSEDIGVKRIGVAEADSIWVTVHLTEHIGEEHLDKIEDEVIAKSYEEMGLISNIEQIQLGERL